jgi:predicted acylesterase/phospholipase RssA
MAGNSEANTANDTCAEEPKRGEHDYVDLRGRKYHNAPFDQTPVGIAEREAIEGRRETIRDAKEGKGKKNGPDRTGCPHTGLALSGGGIRSAAFNLGALQALHAFSGIEGIDYLSTVSGGGYIGCCLTAALAAPKAKKKGHCEPKEHENQSALADQKEKNPFPFTRDDSNDDTPAVHHIRDYSNYLKPHGLPDAISSTYVICRGLVANVLIVAPFLFFFAWLTLFNHPSVYSLNRPSVMLNWVWSHLPFLWPLKDFALGLQGFWLTAILVSLNILFLSTWVILRMISEIVFYIFASDKFGLCVFKVFAWLSNKLFYFTLFGLVFDIQILVLKLEAASFHPNTFPGAAAWASGLPSWASNFFTSTPKYLAVIGSVIAYFYKYFGDVAARAARSPYWIDWFKKIMAKAALWFAALVIPLFLWDLCLQLSLIGLTGSDDANPYPFLPHWLSDLVLGLAKVVEYITPLWISDFVGWLQNIFSFLTPTTAARLYLLASLFTLVSARLAIDPNATSLHSLYEYRLRKAFLFDPDHCNSDQENPDFKPKLHEIDTKLCPYPIINASLNLQGSAYANRRGREADFFVFTPLYTGSDATGYVRPELTDKEDVALNDLSSAMAISGAAVSPNMGSGTIRLLTFTLAFLNIRLGYWARNPLTFNKAKIEEGICNSKIIKLLKNWVLDRKAFLLIREMFSRIDETSRIVYLTDGGHLENLGVYALLRRRCKLIIAIDAEEDPKLQFPSFLTLERYARIDLGATIELPWNAIADQGLRTAKAFEKAKVDEKAQVEVSPVLSSAGPHCAAGDIKYSEKKGDTGILLYFKASLSGDEDDYILDYKRRHPDFPHEATSDQFFGEEQFEAYRALGFHIVKGVFGKSSAFAVQQMPGETEDEARGRIREKIYQALRSTKSSIK